MVRRKLRAWWMFYWTFMKIIVWKSSLKDMVSRVSPRIFCLVGQKVQLQLWIGRSHILEKARDILELDRVIGKTIWIEEKDIPSLPYIQSILKETMRLHPVAPMLVPRMAREDCKVASDDIQKETIVLVNVWSIGRDPELWDEPNEFKPDRFLGREIDVKGQDFELLPFGSGRRMCPDNALGM